MVCNGAFLTFLPCKQSPSQYNSNLPRNEIVISWELLNIFPPTQSFLQSSFFTELFKSYVVAYRAALLAEMSAWSKCSLNVQELLLIVLGVIAIISPVSSTGLELEQYLVADAEFLALFIQYPFQQTTQSSMHKAHLIWAFLSKEGRPVFLTGLNWSWAKGSMLVGSIFPKLETSWYSCCALQQVGLSNWLRKIFMGLKWLTQNLRVYFVLWISITERG